MLKPTVDRLNYGEMLEPPVGYSLHSAIGTTYSLDFSALTGICMSLGLSADIGSKLMSNPIYLFEALRRTSGKIAVFCEGGQIHLPPNNSPLYILLEKMIFEVKLRKKERLAQYPSFHPKFWLIKYVDASGMALYRLLVLSRNLTLDRSWDVAVKLDGKKSDGRAGRSEPISDFAAFLASTVTGDDANSRDKRRLVRELADEVRFVDFNLDVKEFFDIHFVPVGISGNGMKETPLFTDTFHEVLIMSPFLSASVIADFNKRNRGIENPRCTLITRRESLAKLKIQHCDKFRIFAMKDEIIDGAAVVSEENTGIYQQDIHAKLYLWRKGSAVELYLGSLNASDSALNGNIEFMVRLVSKNRFLNTEILTRSLFCGDEDGPDNPFEICKLPDHAETEADPQNILTNRIKAFCRGRLSARAVQQGEGYSIVISIEQVSNFDGITIGPLLSNRVASAAPHLRFDHLSLMELSSFYRVTAKEGGFTVSRVIKIETTGIPGQRESALVSR